MQSTAQMWGLPSHRVTALGDGLRAPGRVALNRYIVVHDCGRMINPMLVEG